MLVWFVVTRFFSFLGSFVGRGGWEGGSVVCVIFLFCCAYLVCFHVLFFHFCSCLLGEGVGREVLLFVLFFVFLCLFGLFSFVLLGFFCCFFFFNFSSRGTCH